MIVYKCCGCGNETLEAPVECSICMGMFSVKCESDSYVDTLFNEYHAIVRGERIAICADKVDAQLLVDNAFDDGKSRNSI